MLRTPDNLYFTPLTLGQRVYFTIHDMIVEATVLELENIWSVDSTGPAIWEYISQTETRIVSSSEPKDKTLIKITPPADTSWPFWELTGFPKDAKWVNQLVSIDEPVGHAVHLDDEIFLTLQEAHQSFDFDDDELELDDELDDELELDDEWPSLQILQQQLQHWRDKLKAFIQSTHGDDPAAEINWPVYPEKNVWLGGG